MKLNHPALIDLLQMAYSAEKAAAFAYQGHAGSVKDKNEKSAIHIPSMCCNTINTRNYSALRIGAYRRDSSFNSMRHSNSIFKYRSKTIR